ncbi:hypothetical protein B0H10DRAFT_1963133 [Mycena sp. CBHHK59/15]|nr:hypothetical protein B0H10DRAFT_1963133 [Mycena sp. CBHHK59/15]
MVMQMFPPMKCLRHVRVFGRVSTRFYDLFALLSAWNDFEFSQQWKIQEFIQLAYCTTSTILHESNRSCSYKNVAFPPTFKKVFFAGINKALLEAARNARTMLTGLASGEEDISEHRQNVLERAAIILEHMGNGIQADLDAENREMAGLAEIYWNILCQRLNSDFDGLKEVFMDVLGENEQ